MQNWKTTLSGAIVASGLAGFASTLHDKEQMSLVLMAALGAFLKGWAAKDGAPGKPFAPQGDTQVLPVSPFLDKP